LCSTTSCLGAPGGDKPRAGEIEGILQVWKSRARRAARDWSSDWRPSPNNTGDIAVKLKDHAAGASTTPSASAYEVAAQPVLDVEFIQVCRT
jgi:hypothetical protein